MRNQLQIRSALLGAVAGVTATLCLGAAVHIPGPVGRYTITGFPEHALVLDTVTGKVWRSYFPEHSGTTDPDFLKEKLQ